MKKLKLINDKNLRCPNCKYFKLHFVNYVSKYDFRVKCLNCNATFSCSDRNFIAKVKEAK